MMLLQAGGAMESIPPNLRKLWKEWELRGMILLSLTTQIVLVILGNRRKYIAGAWIRIIVWTAYLLADAIAIMAAGILSNTLGEIYRKDSFGPEYELLAFWAPMMLLHLGGTDAITAYSLEDNELWKRHSFGLVSQAMTTIYIFSYEFLEMVKRLFADLVMGFQDGYASRSIFENHAMSASKALRITEIELGLIYDLRYTKATIVYSAWGIAGRFIGIFLTLIVLLMVSLHEITLVTEKHSHHSEIDRNITLVLLAAALLVELWAFLQLILSDQTAYWLFNIIQYKSAPISLSKVDLRGRVFKEIHDSVRQWTKRYGYDTDLKALYGQRGGRTIESHNDHDLAWSVELDFDQSILPWHLATEIMYYQGGEPNEIGNYLSRYMLYLLIEHPYMLPLGMAHIKFRDIYAGLGDFLEKEVDIRDVWDISSDASASASSQQPVAEAGRSGRWWWCWLKLPPPAASRSIQKQPKKKDPRKVIDMLLQKYEKKKLERSNSVTLHGCKLASQLSNRGNRWEIIGEVWVEMLCHAASQCRGRYHAQQLRRGGE
ncbi:unnamed protein product [Camellia sinensis]